VGIACRPETRRTGIFQAFFQRKIFDAVIFQPKRCQTIEEVESHKGKEKGPLYSRPTGYEGKAVL
jgi:hypothetical protein